ncbi:hypothetical protein RchiOBHm_Chr2g0091791 [Rosa chinensis]|uniref:Uncharacterized protein n=1 Tax=Rosa chinensis TaxID=74649 RepID=A0A2P6RJT3_ROSCH|nr:hypothetical protein RchiOBHm_Chr2g0091791 [Rosa chinensis]
MASLSRNTFVSEAYAIDLCFDLDDALTLPGNTTGYLTNSRTSLESDSTSDGLVANLPTVVAVEGVICSVLSKVFEQKKKEVVEVSKSLVAMCITKLA